MHRRTVDLVDLSQAGICPGLSGSAQVAIQATIQATHSSCLSSRDLSRAQVVIAQRESGDCQGIRPCCGREGMNGVCQDILFDSLTLMLISLPDEQGQRVW